jgi:hypothetical protein
LDHGGTNATAFIVMGTGWRWTQARRLAIAAAILAAVAGHLRLLTTPTTAGCSTCHAVLAAHRIPDQPDTNGPADQLTSPRRSTAPLRVTGSDDPLTVGSCTGVAAVLLAIAVFAAVTEVRVAGVIAAESGKSFGRTWLKGATTAAFRLSSIFSSRWRLRPW